MCVYIYKIYYIYYIIYSIIIILLCRCKIGQSPVKISPNGHVLTANTDIASVPTLFSQHLNSLWSRDPRIPIRSYEGCTCESNEVENTSGKKKKQTQQFTLSLALLTTTVPKLLNF